MVEGAAVLVVGGVVVVVVVGVIEPAMASRNACLRRLTSVCFELYDGEETRLLVRFSFE